jgi:hypothetical protein
MLQKDIYADRRREPRHNVEGPCWFDVGGALHSGRLTEVSALGAYVRAVLCPAVGTALLLSHSLGGAIVATVVRSEGDGFAVQFSLGEPSVTFALRVIAGALVAMEQD